MITIFQGETKTFNITLRDKEGNPKDLTSVVEITACVKAETTVITKLFVGPPSDITIVGDVKLGKIKFTLSEVETDTLPPTKNGGLEILLDFGSGNKPKGQDVLAFQVLEKLCP